MITRKTSRGIIILVMLTTISFWISRQKGDDGPDPVTDLDPSLNYVLRDFELQVFDKDGKASLNIQAPVLRNYPEQQLGAIESPVMVFHQPGARWDLTADTATLTADKEHIVLEGRVKLQRQELESGNWWELNTREVNIEVTPQTGSTDQAVTIFDGRNHLSGIGMDLDLLNNSFQIHAQVRATYAVN